MASFASTEAAWTNFQQRLQGRFAVTREHPQSIHRATRSHDIVLIIGYRVFEFKHGLGLVQVVVFNWVHLPLMLSSVEVVFSWGHFHLNNFLITWHIIIQHAMLIFFKLQKSWHYFPTGTIRTTIRTMTITTITKIKRGKKVNLVEFDPAGGHLPPLTICLYTNYSSSVHS